MADATNTVTVDGVEPSILVSLLDVKDNPERVKLYTADDGTERYLVRGAEKPTLVTGADLGVLGGFAVQMGKNAHEIPVESIAEPPAAQNQPEIVIPVNPITPGQSGQDK